MSSYFSGNRGRPEHTISVWVRSWIEIHLTCSTTSSVISAVYFGSNKTNNIFDTVLLQTYTDHFLSSNFEPKKTHKVFSNIISREIMVVFNPDC